MMFHFSRSFFYLTTICLCLCNLRPLFHSSFRLSMYLHDLWSCHYPLATSLTYIPSWLLVCVMKISETRWISHFRMFWNRNYFRLEPFVLSLILNKVYTIHNLIVKASLASHDALFLLKGLKDPSGLPCTQRSTIFTQGPFSSTLNSSSIKGGHQQTSRMIHLAWYLGV